MKVPPYIKVTTRNIFFNFVYAWLWDHLFCKLNNLGDFLRPSPSKSVRDIVFAKFKDGQFVVTPYMLGYFDWVLIAAPFENQAQVDNHKFCCDLFSERVILYTAMDARIIPDSGGKSMLHTCLVECLEPYYAQFPMAANGKVRVLKGQGKEVVVSEEFEAMLPSVDDFSADLALRRASGGQGLHVTFQLCISHASQAAIGVHIYLPHNVRDVGSSPSVLTFSLSFRSR